MLSDLVREIATGGQFHTSRHVHVIYHSPCPDGTAAAMVANKFFRESGIGNAHKPIQLHPCNYGGTAPCIPGDSVVFFLDFSWKRERLQELCDRSAKVIVLDHHKSAEEDLKDFQHKNAHIIFDMEKSGCGLAWEFFFPGEPVPMLIQYIQDRDLWRFEFGDQTRKFASFLQSQESTIVRYEELMDWLNGQHATEVVVAMDACYQLEQNLVKRICKSSFFASIHGYTVPVVNTGLYPSEVGHELLQKFPDAPFAATFYKSGAPSGMWRWGLRGRGDVDVSEIASAYGGGGHHNAAGFEVEAGLVGDVCRAPWELRW